MNLRGYMVNQFRRPHGALGHVAGWIMSRRASNRERNLWTLELLQVEPGHRILEIGFGPGYAIEQLLDRYPGIRVTGVDHSQIMLSQASSRNRDALSRGQVALYCVSVEGLEAFAGSFDRVYSSNVAQFWPDRVRVFGDILSLLRPGGCVATTYLPRHPKASDADAIAFGQTLVEEMRAAGFESVSLEHGPSVPVLTVSAVGTRPAGP